MKVRLTIRQLIKVLKTEVPKFPITFVMGAIDIEELEELIEILKREK